MREPSVLSHARNFLSSPTPKTFPLYKQSIIAHHILSPFSVHKYQKKNTQNKTYSALLLFIYFFFLLNLWFSLLMASSSVSLRFTSVLLLQLIIIFQSHSQSHASVLVLPLSHSLSTSQFNSTPHLLKSTATHSATRFRHHCHRHRHRHVSLPLNPGSDYTLSFTLGGSSQSQSISLYMDTGSDVVWLPCHPFTCILCEGKYNPATVPYPHPLNLTTSATPVTCKSRACSSVHSSLPSSDLCAIANCPLEDIETSDCKKFKCPPFYYAYGDGSLVANLYTDSLSLSLSSPSLVMKDFTFGCAHSTLGEPIGVAGFGRGRLSLPAQLANSAPDIGNHFSYCLVSHSFDTARVRMPSPLILGRYTTPAVGEDKEKKQTDQSLLGGFAYTPMLKNPKHPYFYCVGLEGVSVGKKKIQAPVNLRRVDRRGNGGMVVDSGTTFTMLPKGFYDSVVTEFDRRVGSVYKRAYAVEDRTGLGPCYYMDKKLKSSPTTNTAGAAADNSKKVVVVPEMLLHFGGNSSVAMPKRNYFYEFVDGDGEGENVKTKRKVGCMMLMNGGDQEESGGPAGLLGNYQQQGFEVVYDLEKGRVGFARRKCSSLWESLNG